MFNVKNETLKKLTREEIAGLDLYAHGIYTYKGFAKARVKGLKTTLKTEDEVHYEGEHLRWEVIKIIGNADGMNEYAIRCFDKDKNEYADFYQVLIGCDFLKFKK